MHVSRRSGTHLFPLALLEDSIVSHSTSKDLYKAPRTDISQNQGKFRIHFNFPGRNHPTHDDHGYGPLSAVVESFMDPGTLIRMHPHQNEEIISWVPTGVMRHDDRDGNKLVTDQDHLMIMGAGSGFWHAEETLQDDPPLRMLQIFVRPHSLGLPPTIQHEGIPDPTPNEWRTLFGPEGTDNALTVRNDVFLHDIHLADGASVALPTQPDWDTYFYVFEGSIEADSRSFNEAESGLYVGGDELRLSATADSIVVAFVINPAAPITKQGTIGR
ncbi:pirin family protein [Halorubraceae archaeon YAN]|nr:pirin family protein [Halorubraceae archaeon YAN]